MPAPRSLIIPEATWDATARLVTGYAEAKVEAGLYWYGIRSADVAVVIVAGIPQQTNRRQNFVVNDDDLAALVKGIPDGLVVVAQIHTHPNSDTLHSKWDDGLIVSQKILSLVLPKYGRAASLREAGVHEFIDGRWMMLSPEKVAERVLIVPGVFDVRR